MTVKAYTTWNDRRSGWEIALLILLSPLILALVVVGIVFVLAVMIFLLIAWALGAPLKIKVGEEVTVYRWFTPIKRYKERKDK